MTEEQEIIPYWNVNVPRREWTAEPSAALANVGEDDRKQLSIRDEDYHILGWKDVQNTIQENRLEIFKRVPSDLRRYREHMAVNTKDYGSVLNFILTARLHWTDLTARAPPFEDPSDLKILMNDWPYGVDPRIIHLVVWTKFSFEDDPNTGDLTPEARRQIDQFVTRTFRQNVNPEHVAWFKNWSSIKSIHAVDHFHVMLYDPDPAFIQRITGNDVATSTQLDANNPRVDLEQHTPDHAKLDLYSHP